MTVHVLHLEHVDRLQTAAVGGKGAQLGELSRIEGIRVPRGFCVTTDAFRRALAQLPAVDDLLDRLARMRLEDHDRIQQISADIRHTIEAVAMPQRVAEDIGEALRRVGERSAYAIRSSATAEDLPGASFAGQQDSYLNILGLESVLRHVTRCWASLFTERAVVYRMRHGFDHRQIFMAVVVQRMVFPRASGLLFTADPLTSNRKVASIEASFGLGEALVGGLVNADNFRVREGVIVDKTIRDKEVLVDAVPGGGTQQRTVEARLRPQPTLSDAEALALAQCGRRIEAHFGSPQDIEWCLAEDGFHFVQSRPITTLFPVPAAADGENHVYISVGHQQMMTDALQPLGLSLWRLVNPRMVEAGGRLFVDVSQALASPATRASQLAMIEKGQPLIRDALETILQRGDFIRTLPDDPGHAARPTAATIKREIEPAVVAQLVARAHAELAAAQRGIEGKTGPALLDFILDDLQQVKRFLFDPQSFQVISAGIDALWWLNEHLREWLGEKNAADTLTQSAPGNVTTQMGLDLLDVADVIRPHADVVAFLERADHDGFLHELGKLSGGPAAEAAIRAWLDKYGMRCVGEIDITRPSWRERPSMLLPMLRVNIRSFEAGEGQRRWRLGLAHAGQKEKELLERLRALPDGDRRAAEARQMIEQARSLVGYREYPKYAWMSRLFVYKQALMAEAHRLADAGVLAEAEDIFSLRFEELHDVMRRQQADRCLISERKQAFKIYQNLFPPPVLTSEGEAVAGSYRRGGLPPGALVGMGVSAGVVEGRARIMRDVDRADLQAGDILVTAFTDPSWTPLFVAIGGLVTEVGGPMTHGAVIAREYGLPAVVGVPNATRLIQDGQRIRVHGGDGYVELLPPSPAAA
jgi:rifampicin phosphotransferase